MHDLSLTLPKFELYEQGPQVRPSSKSIKDQIVEGYGRRRYKADFIKFLVYAHASCDETINQLETINHIYFQENPIKDLIDEYNVLGSKINRFIKYVETSWNDIDTVREVDPMYTTPTSPPQTNSKPVTRNPKHTKSTPQRKFKQPGTRNP